MVVPEYPTDKVSLLEAELIVFPELA